MTGNAILLKNPTGCTNVGDTPSVVSKGSLRKTKVSSLLGHLRIVRASPASSRLQQQPRRFERTKDHGGYPNEVVVVDGGGSDQRPSVTPTTGDVDHLMDPSDRYATEYESCEPDSGVETTLESMRRLTKKPSRFTFDIVPSYSLSMDGSENNEIVVGITKNVGIAMTLRARTRTSSTAASSEVSTMDGGHVDDGGMHQPSLPRKAQTATVVPSREGSKKSSSLSQAKTTASTVFATTPGSIPFWPSLVTPTTPSSPNPGTCSTATNQKRNGGGGELSSWFLSFGWPFFG